MTIENLRFSIAPNKNASIFSDRDFRLLTFKNLMSK